MLDAAACDDFVGGVFKPVLTLELADDGLLEFRTPVGGGVMSSAFLRCLRGRVADEIRRGEIRLAGGQVEDLAPSGGEFLCTGVDRHGGGGLDDGKTLGRLVVHGIPEFECVPSIVTKPLLRLALPGSAGVPPARPAGGRRSDDVGPYNERMDMQTNAFKLESGYQPTGDQPTAIAGLTRGIEDGLARQVLLEIGRAHV